MNQQISIEEMCKKLRPILDKKADALYFQYVMSSELLVKKQIEQIIPSSAITKIFNLSVWSFLAVIFMMGGSIVSSIGVKLLKVNG